MKQKIEFSREILLRAYIWLGFDKFFISQLISFSIYITREKRKTVGQLLSPYRIVFAQNKLGLAVYYTD